MFPCSLILPDASLSDEIRAYRAAFLESGDSMDGCGSLRRHENPADWLEYNRLLSSWETMPRADWVPSTQFVYLRKSDRRIVGMLQVRHELNDFLQYAGHIGYCVRPDERRKGYAAAMLRDALPYCRSLGLSRVMISCLESNEGSRRTILRNGGVYDSTVLEPTGGVYLERYWIELR